VFSPADGDEYVLEIGIAANAFLFIPGPMSRGNGLIFDGNKLYLLSLYN